MEVFWVRATVTDSEKIFSFGLCIHSVMSPEKFGIPQFAVTSDAVPYLLAVN